MLSYVTKEDRVDRWYMDRINRLIKYYLITLKNYTPGYPRLLFSIMLLLFIFFIVLYRNWKFSYMFIYAYFIFLST